MSSSHKIAVILNNYSYFTHEFIKGPKSLIKYLELLEENNCEINIFSNNIDSFGIFPFKVKLIDLTLKNTLLEIHKYDLIITDRANILWGLFISFIFRKKLVIRILGNGFRLNSTNIISYKNLIRILSFIVKIDLIISTNDGSSFNGPSFIKAKNRRHRINGVNKLSTTKNNADLNHFFGICRYSRTDDKGIESIIKFYKKILGVNSNAKLHLFGAEADYISHLDKNLFEKKSITAYGFIKNNELQNRICNFGYMISGNQHGALGNAELESLSAQKAIIYIGPQKHLENLTSNIRSGYINPEDFLKNNFKNVSFLHELENFEKVHANDVKVTLSLI